MMRTFKAGTVAVLVALLLASGTSAQAPSPEGEPLPYGGYLAALEEFAASSAATTEHLGPASTVADVAAAYQESLALVEADQQRMLGIVPEPCYAAAHEEVLAYRETAIEFFREALPLMAESKSVLDIFGVFEAMDADLRERHPAAYTEDPDAGGGFKGSYRTILAALVTCDEPASQRPWLRGRVEMLEHGFALTLPDGWVGIDMAGDIDQQITAVAEHLAAEPLQGHKPDLRAAVARSEDLGGWLVDHRRCHHQQLRTGRLSGSHRGDCQ